MARQNESMASYARNLDNRYGFPPGTMETLVRTESNGKGDATSSKGARGYAQLMPSAMTDAGLDGVDPASLSYRQQLSIAAAHLNRGMDQFGDIGMALAGYNAGNTRMAAVKGGKTSLPRETANYLQKFSDAGIIPPDSEALQYAQSGRRTMGRDYQQPDFSDVDKAIAVIGDTSAWEAKRAQFANQQAGRPTASSWEDKRAQFLASNSGQDAPQQEMAQSNLNPQMNYLSPELIAAPEQAARGIANIPSTLADAGVSLVNNIGEAAAWANGVLGVNDGSFHPLQPTYRPIDQPTDTYAKIGQEIGPFLIPGVAPERAAAAMASVANAPRAERAATQVASMLAENLPGTLAASQRNGQIDPSRFAEETALGLAGSTLGRAVVRGGEKVVNAVRGAGRDAGAGAQATATTGAREMGDSGAIPPVAESTNATAASYATAAQSRQPGRIADVINDIQPNQEAVSASRQLGLDPDDMLESYTSGNDAFKAVQMGLASKDESALAAVKRDSIKRISERAAKIIDDAGAMPDRLAMDDKFKASFEITRKTLKAKEKELFTPINESIAPRSIVDSTNAKNMLDDMADDVGGYQYLSPVEKEVYEAISPTTDKSGPLTYQRLKNVMNMVGAELEKSGTPFGSTKERNLSSLYSALSKDRDAVAISNGLSEQLKTANAVTAQRKMMEKRVYELIGKDLSGDVTVKAQNALNGLYSGNTKPFIQLMRSMPDKEMRNQLIATGMRDMLRKGSRSDLADNINGLVDFYGELKRKGTVRLLARELPPQTMHELENFYTLGRSVKDANRFHLPNGKLNGFLKEFDQPGGFVDQLSRHGKMAFIATAMGHVPVVGPVLNTSIAAHMGAKQATRKAGAEAVQELMTSPVWKELAAKARANPNAATQEKIAAVMEKRISRMEPWKEFYRTLPAAEKDKIARVGIIAWLSGAGEDE